MPDPVFPPQENLRAGPGHYTMVREGLVADPGPVSSRPSSAQGPPGPDEEDTPASAPSRKSLILTIISLVVVIAVAAALVIFFALTN